MMVSLVCLQTWLDGKLPSKVDMRMGKAFANEGIATKPGLLIVHVCSLSHQCRVLLLSLSHPFCVYVRSLSLSLRGYMVSHRSSLLRRSGRTALVVVHPLPNRQAPCRLEQAPARRWRRPLPPPGRQAGFGSPHVARNRPDRLLPGSTADEARCCCYYYYCYCY